MYDGCKLAMEADKSITVQVVEPTEVAEFEGHYMELAKTGEYDLIIGSGFDGVEAVTKVSGLFPEQKFMFVDGDCGDLPNVTSVTFRDNEKAFLLGYMAAKKTATGKLGFVGGMDIPSINMFAAGFEAGAAYADKNVTVERKYVGAWNDTSTGKELALALYDAGCDIVFQVASRTGEGVFEAAAERGLYAIGVDSDQKYINPDVIICSMIKQVNLSIEQAVTAYATEGTWMGGQIWVADMATGLIDVGYGDDTMTQQVSDELKAEVEEIKAQIIAGEIEVPTAFVG